MVLLDTTTITGHLEGHPTRFMTHILSFILYVNYLLTYSSMYTYIKTYSSCNLALSYLRVI